MGFSRGHRQTGVRRLAWMAVAALAVGPALHAAPPEKPAPPSGKSGRIVKWVDRQGVTHYGDRLPAEYADHANSVLSGKGTVLKKNEAALPPEIQAKRKAEEKQLAEQQRRDRALLSTFASEQEIDLARDRHLQQDAAAIDNLMQDMASAQKRLATDTQYVESLKARHQPVPEEVTHDIANSRREIDRLQNRIEQRRQAMEATRQRFEEDKLRYRAAKARSLEGAPGSVKPTSSSGSR